MSAAANLDVDIKLSNRKAFKKKSKKKKVRKQVWHLEAEFSMTNRFTNETFGPRSVSERERKEMMDHIDRFVHGRLRYYRYYYPRQIEPVPYYVIRVLPWEELVKCEGNVLVNIRTSIEPRNRLNHGKYEPYNASWFYEKTAPYRTIDDLSALNMAERCLVKHKYRVRKGWYRYTPSYGQSRWEYRYDPKKYIRDERLSKKQGRFSQSQKSKPVKAEAISEFLDSDSCVTTPCPWNHIVLDKPMRYGTPTKTSDIMPKVEHVFDIEIVFRCSLGKGTEEVKTYNPESSFSQRNVRHGQYFGGVKKREKQGKKRNKLVEQLKMQNMPLQV